MIHQEILDKLNWRYATKKYDVSKKLTKEELNGLLQAIQLSPSSYGIQPYKVLVITNPEIREKLKAAGYGQPQITDASHLFVFTTYNNFDASHIDEYAQNIVETRGVNLEDIDAFVALMKSVVSSRNTEELKVWNSKQAYIALGVLLETAALLGLDTSPMEGFDSSKFDEILNLKNQNLTSVVIAAVGHRSSEDEYQHYKKVRKQKENLFIEI